MLQALHDPDRLQRLTGVATLLLAVLAAWLLARLAWTLFTPLPSPALPEPPESFAPAAGSPEFTPALSRWHLFGEYQAPPALAALRDAPETALDLQLRGIVASSDPESGYAIIVHQGRQGVYGVGQALPGDVRVRAVYADRVVLLRDGNPETLRLPVERPGSATPREAAPAVPEAPQAPPLLAALPAVREALAQHGQGDAPPFGLVPVSTGGFRLFLGRDAQAIAALGLQNGDIILSANGIALDSEAKVEQALESVLAGGTLALEVRRGGRTLTVRPDVAQLVD
ncbi:MAG: type II secretion system protein GspC [Xanthomonadales bacterium]|nr:type II secretion system protein GspC [Xanthomonadales bacterium]